MNEWSDLVIENLRFWKVRMEKNLFKFSISFNLIGVLLYEDIKILCFVVITNPPPPSNNIFDIFLNKRVGGKVIIFLGLMIILG